MKPCSHIAIASSKGGTSKITLAVALVLAAPTPVCLTECDVAILVTEPTP
jgi:MinD superfamily P-loop ATPase